MKFLFFAQLQEGSPVTFKQGVLYILTMVFMDFGGG